MRQRQLAGCGRAAGLAMAAFDLLRQVWVAAHSLLPNHRHGSERRAALWPAYVAAVPFSRFASSRLTLHSRTWNPTHANASACLHQRFSSPRSARSPGRDQQVHLTVDNRDVLWTRGGGEFHGSGGFGNVPSRRKRTKRRDMHSLRFHGSLAFVRATSATPTQSCRHHVRPQS